MDRVGARVLAVAPFAAAALGALILAFAVMVFIGSRGFGYDFAAYDEAARRITAGASVYVPDTAARYAAGEYEGLYLYPPQLAIAMVALTVFEPTGATLAWLSIRIGLLALGCAVLPVRPAIRFLAFAVACVSYPVLFDLNLGNISVLAFALSAIAWRTADRPAAAFAHAALIAMRFPFGIFFVQWLVQRRWRAILWTIAAGVTLILLSLPIVGVSTYLDYVTILRGLPDISTGPHNLSLRSTALSLGVGPDLAALVMPIGYLVGLGAVVYAARKRDPDLAFVVTATATMMVSPFIHPHYLVLLLLPAALLADRGRGWALALPLVGWLPDPFLPLAAPLAVVLLLTTRPVAASSSPSPVLDPPLDPAG
jgi:Glycosyltransferase family 87